MQSIEDKIVSRIYGRRRGWAFTPNDFVGDFQRANIDKALSMLAKQSRIRRVYRGVYDYPKYSELLQQDLSPDYDQVAQAFARKFNWRIQPTGDAALNLLGLSTQVPGRAIYLSDGPSRSYTILDTFTLEFKKSALKEVGFKTRESGLVVQALKALGKERIDEQIVASLRNQLDEKTRKKISKETVTATGWVYEAIKRICTAGVGSLLSEGSNSSSIEKS